ncbi:hypothetical protein ACLMI9_08920, partial [Bifidobacterium adolescentis]|uniref:hypothetical protein n=1 Tax=Bifidobacterium adolescentis TaxID=1680 RepID=UPI00398D060D
NISTKNKTESAQEFGRYRKMQAIHGVTVVYARNSFIAFIAALLDILRVSERPDATCSKKPSCSFSTVHRQPSTFF